MAANAVAVSVEQWLAYFASIRSVCPWSYPAYTAGEIDIVASKTPRPLDSFRARVYVLNNFSPRRIKRLAQKLERSDQQCEWLWSHPRYQPHSAPVGCLIQQSRQELADIRKRLARSGNAS